MDIEKAIKILGEAAIVCFTIDDDFKEACRMGQQALVQRKLLTEKKATCLFKEEDNARATG